MAHYISNHLGDVTRASSKKNKKKTRILCFSEECIPCQVSALSILVSEVKVLRFCFRDTHPNWLANTCPIDFSFFLCVKTIKKRKKSSSVLLFFVWLRCLFYPTSRKKNEEEKGEMHLAETKTGVSHSRETVFKMKVMTHVKSGAKSGVVDPKKPQQKSAKKNKEKREKGKRGRRKELLFFFFFLFVFVWDLCKKKKRFTVFVDRCAITRISALSAVDCGAVDHNGCYG